MLRRVCVCVVVQRAVVISVRNSDGDVADNDDGDSPQATSQSQGESNDGVDDDADRSVDEKGGYK